MPDYLDRNAAGQPNPVTPRRALAGVPVQNDNVSPAGDLAVALEDGSTAGRYLSIDTNGRIRLSGTPDDLTTVLSALLIETMKLRYGMMLTDPLTGIIPDVSIDDLPNEYLLW